MGSCAAPSAKGDDKFITTDYLQQCQKINKTVRREYDFHHFPRLFPIPYCPACFSWSAICSFTFCVRTPLSGIFWLFIRSS
ncbi:hypothetical protein FNJ69_24775 (plasmid) [Escherichia coli]|nr:hypothetical protein FNJ69_24775 [Escherichia coli]